VRADIVSCVAVCVLTLSPVWLCACLQAMYTEYRAVTETEKAEVVGLGGLHVVGTGEGTAVSGQHGVSCLCDIACMACWK
jgi:hypothetical protein